VPRYVEVAHVSEIPPGTAKPVLVEGREVALFHLGGQFYAIDNCCPHQGGPLAEGWIEGTVVVCPWHAWCFDVRDGSSTIGLTPVDAFDVQVAGSAISVSSEPRT
jgi:nitrite reductase (NADH) small subunit